MKKFITDFIGKIKQNISQRNYKEVFFACMALLVLLVLAIGAVWIACIGIAQVINFVSRNFLYIIAMVLLSVCGVVWIREKAQVRQDELAERKSREQIENELAHQAISEDSYQIARQALFEILSSVAKNCNLEPPEDLSSLDAPRHFTTRCGVLILQYIAIPRGEINIQTITSLIENRFRQMGLAHELNFEPSTIVAFGQTHPALMVDSVNDLNSFVQINLTFTTENYIKQRVERQRQNLQSPHNHNNHKDDDF